MEKLSFIMVVDDDPINNFVCEKIIRLSGVCSRVESVLSAADALKKLESAGEENTPDLVFLDINMPGMNGWDFLEQFKKIKDRLPKEIRIFMLSSSMYTEDIDRSRAYEEVSGYISKPISVERLKEISREYFSG